MKASTARRIGTALGSLGLIALLALACSQFGEGESAPAAVDAASDTSEEGDASAPRPDASPAPLGDGGSGSGRLECRSNGRLALGPDEPLGSPPPAATGPRYLWGIAPAGKTVFVSTGDKYDGGAGYIFRVDTSVTPATWTLFAQTSHPGPLQIRDGYLFAIDLLALTRYPLECPPPCTGQATIAVQPGALIDAFWIEHGDSVFIAPTIGDVVHGYRAESGWESDRYGPIDVARDFRSIAVTDDALYVAQLFTAHVQHFPLSTRPATAPSLPVGGNVAVLADCDRVFTLGAPVLAWQPLTGSRIAIGEAGAGYAWAIDEDFVYAGYADGFGLTRFRKDGTNPTGEPVAPGRSVWGIGIDADAIYYGDHGREATAGNLFRRAKLSR